MTEAVERIWVSQDWITIILLIIVTLVVFNKLQYAERFSKLASLLSNNIYINNYSKSTPLLFNTFTIVFYFILIIVISLLLFVALNTFSPASSTDTASYFLLIFIYVFVFIITRFIIGLLLGILFEKEKEQHYFTFLKISYLSNFCLFLIPVLIVYFYIDLVNFSRYLIFGSLLLFLFYYALLIKHNQKLIFSKMFYFILYLCALEIAPFIIIYNLLIMQGVS